MFKLVSVLILISLTSCAGLGTQSADMADKNLAVVSLSDDQKRSIHLEEFSPKKEVSRAPASVGSYLPEGSISNKELYFVTLFYQTKSLGSLLNEGSPDLKFCPAFHSTVVKYLSTDVRAQNTSLKKSVTRALENASSINELVISYPLLGMVYTDLKELEQKIVDKNFQEIYSDVTETLSSYNERNKEEIATLCEYGSSEEYFVYENMITYYKNDMSFHYSPTSLHTVIRMPVYSNTLLLKTATSESKWGTSVAELFETNLLERSNTSWFNQYIKKIHRAEGRLLVRTGY